MITLDKNVSIPCLPIEYVIIIIIIINAVNGRLSNTFPLAQEVPQGSLLGPLLFTEYTSELVEIVRRHLPSVTSYADDRQLYLAFSPNVQGDDASAVKQEQLRNVKHIQATGSAFAAVLQDGSAVAWGHPCEGGDSSAV